MRDFLSDVWILKLNLRHKVYASIDWYGANGVKKVGLRRVLLNCYNCKQMEELIEFTWNFRIILEKQHTLNQQYLIDPEISEKIIFLKRNGDE